jgi:hypothetical protein
MNHFSQPAKFCVARSEFSSYPQAVDDLEGLFWRIADNMNTFCNWGAFLIKIKMQGIIKLGSS